MALKTTTLDSLRRLGVGTPKRKLIRTNDGAFRMRRGQLVRIPDEWVGKTAWPMTVSSRQSKHIRKFRRNATGLSWRQRERYRGRLTYERKAALEDVVGFRKLPKVGHPLNFSPRHMPAVERDDQRLAYQEDVWDWWNDPRYDDYCDDWDEDGFYAEWRENNPSQSLTRKLGE